MSVTSHDVARLAGVSQPTVSRALRAGNQVSERTRTRVIAAAQELGYVPSERGRILATRTTRQIAVVASIDNSLYPQLMPPLHDTFAARGYRTVLLAESHAELISDERLLDGSVDGAVLTTSSLRSPLPARLRAHGVPFVEFNRTSGTVPVDSVTADNHGGGRAVAELLAAGHHRDIAALLGPAQTSTAREREAGLREALREHRIRLPSRWVRRVWYSEEDGRAAMSALLDAGARRPDAVFCVNDMVGVGALNALIERGIEVPTEMAVIGFDDLAVAGWPAFRLTSVRVDFAAMARRAAELLIDRIADADRPYVAERFPVRLVLRHSHRR